MFEVIFHMIICMFHKRKKKLRKQNRWCEKIQFYLTQDEKLIRYTNLMKKIVLVLMSIWSISLDSGWLDSNIVLSDRELNRMSFEYYFCELRFFDRSVAKGPRLRNLTIRSITPDQTPISDLIISDHTKNLTQNRSLWSLISRQAIRSMYGPRIRSCIAIYDSYNKIKKDLLTISHKNILISYYVQYNSSRLNINSYIPVSKPSQAYYNSYTLMGTFLYQYPRGYISSPIP